jgi:hypothetical protein
MVRLKYNPTRSKVFAVGLFICGLSLTSGVALLRAQQPADLPSNSDLPSKPEAASNPSDNNSASASQSPSAPSRSNAVSTPEGLTFGERLRIYERSFINPESLIGPAMGAGIGQWRNTPSEWGQGAEGFGRRFASGYGRSVIGRTIGFGVATVDHEDPRFVPSNESGIWRRTKHAVAWTFISRNDRGGVMPAFSRLAGVYGAGFIANAWEPPSQDTNRAALVRGSTALLSSVGWHVFEEFWPDIRNKLHRH